MTQHLQIGSDMLYTIPETLPHQHLCVFRNTECVMQWHPYPFSYKAITDCRFHRAVGKKSSLFWSSKETTVAREARTTRQTGARSLLDDCGFWVRLPNKHRGGDPSISQCRADLLGSPALGLSTLRSKRVQTAQLCFATSVLTPGTFAAAAFLFLHNPI